MKAVCVFGLCLLIASPALAQRCVPDGSAVSVRGKIVKLSSHDKNTGQAYSYLILRADKSYCLFGQYVDQVSATPTSSLMIDDKVGATTEATPFIGKFVTVVGKIFDTNGGGPMVTYTSITP